MWHRLRSLFTIWSTPETQCMLDLRENLNGRCYCSAKRRPNSADVYIKGSRIAAPSGGILKP